MVTDNKYRWDFIGLSTDNKPTPATSDKVVDGSTFYCSDNSKLYIFCKDQWYEKEGTGGTTYTAGDNITISDGVISATDTTYNNFTGTDGTDAGAAGLVPAPAATDADKFLKSDGTWATAGGGSGPTVVQSTGNSTTDVMSQNATTGIVFADTDYRARVQIGRSANNTGDYGVAISWASTNLANRGIAIGNNSATSASADGSVAIGAYSVATFTGQFNIGSTNTLYGYNSSNYRRLTGVYDGQSLHDAATVAQGNTLATTAPTTATEGVLGQLYTDTTNMHTYQCTAIDTTDPDNPAYTWTQRW